VEKLKNLFLMEMGLTDPDKRNIRTRRRRAKGV